MFKQRIAKLRKAIASKCEGMFIEKKANIRYLSGYTGDGAFLIITGSAQYLITDSRFLEQAETECPDMRVVLYDNKTDSFFSTVASICKAESIKTLGFEEGVASYQEYQRLASALEGVALSPAGGSVEALRRAKDEAEIAYMREACTSTDEVFAKLLKFIRAGLSEKELEWEIMRLMQLTGNGNYAEFATLSGVNGSLPHGKASYNKIIEPGDFITMDFGCICNGYHADMTRTVLVGEATPKQREVYSIVLEAQKMSQAAVAPGVPAKEIDRIGRDHIESKGYGKYFGHGMGHGVGLEIHEEPGIRGSSQAILAPGDIITVEPGIYLPGWGGIRIEDTILVTDTGAESLFTSSKELISL